MYVLTGLAKPCVYIRDFVMTKHSLVIEGIEEVTEETYQKF